VYANRARLPRTLTAAEQGALLQVTGERATGYRDHVIFSLVLGTGLRAMEVAALDVGDVLTVARGGRASIELRVFKRCTDNPAPQVVAVPDALRHKLTKFGKWKRARGESIDRSDPLFVTRGGRGAEQGARLSRWGIHKAWCRWRERAELPKSLTFHALRHTFAQNLYDSAGDLEVVRAAVRHADISSTTIYAQASSERVARAVRELPC
jgi:site-specific recombinase XerD